jgi:hypothetical protein
MWRCWTRTQAKRPAAEDRNPQTANQGLRRGRCRATADAGGAARTAEHLIIDTAGFGNQAATIAAAGADLVLVLVTPGEGDLVEAQRTVSYVEGAGQKHSSRDSRSGDSQPDPPRHYAIASRAV